MIGACGISASMSARVIHQMGRKERPFSVMPAVSVNVGGQIGSVIAGEANFSAYWKLKRG